MPQPPRDERGFTLVEVLIAVTIQALIIGALGMAFISILNGSKNVNQSLSRSSDARLASAYFQTDAGNSSGPEVSLSDTTSCPDPSPPVSGTASPVVRFSWTSTSSAGASTTNIVNYVLVSNSLLRRVCKNGVLQSDRAVASNVQTAVASCAPTADCSGTPTSIKVVVTSVADTAGNQFSYTIYGTFRKLNGAGPTAASNPKSVVLLGASTTCSGTTPTVEIYGGANLTVYGDAYVNAKDGTSCKAMYLHDGGSFSAGGTKILTGGSCQGQNVGQCPTVTSYTPAITDPYSALTAPSTSGMTSRTGCSGPGLYASGMSITSGTCTLTSGIYYVQNGLTVTNGASLATASGGVLIYLASGVFNIGSASSVSIAPMTTGTYAGLAFWQAAADVNAITINNGVAPTFSGALYAPKATLDIEGGTHPKFSSVVVQILKMNNGVGVTIGTASADPLTLTGPMSYASSWTVNRPYPSSTLTASGGDGNYIWTVTLLPPGVSADSQTGVVSGTPTSAGSYSGQVWLNDLLGDDPWGPGSYTLTVNAAPNITTTTLPAGDKSTAYSRTLSVSGGTSNYTWAATGLPAGLSLNTSTGVISGTPSATGTSSISVTVTDAAGATDTQAVSLTINAAPNITTASLASGEKSAPYTSAAAAATGGTTPYTWSASNLPSGLSINSSTGVISGTPGTSGTTTVTLIVTDAAGGTDSQALSLVLAAQPTISSVTLTNKSGGTAGKMEAGDKITIVFNSTMSVSSFCSSWSGDGSNQSLTGANLQVNVANGTTDSITITNTSGSGCTTFNLGTIDMKSGSYVTAATVFGGSSGNTSIGWTASSKTLVITLGALKSGTVATVSSTTSPVFTASGSITDSAGGTLGNSPYTLSPAAVRF